MCGRYYIDDEMAAEISRIITPLHFSIVSTERVLPLVTVSPMTI